MKNRILSLLIASVMVFGLMVIPSYAYAADSIDYSKDIEFINAMGITDAFAENINDPITRRGAVVMAFGLLGKNNMEPQYNGEFADVPVGDVDGGKISYAVANGLIAQTNNGKFIPDGKVKYIDALKLVFNSINYGHLVQGTGKGDSEYYRLASKYKVSVKAASASELTVGEFAHLVALASEAPLLRVESVEGDGYINYRVDESVTVLSTYYDIYKINGTVEKNNFTSLYESTPLLDWGISIDGVIINCDDTTDTQNLLGRRVYAYYREKDMKLVYYTFENDDDVIRLECEDIEKYNNNAYYCFEGSKEKKYICTRNAAIIYNGVAVTSAYYSDFITQCGFVPANGYVELVKNDSGNIDCIKITNYKTYVVQGIDIYNEKIIDKYGEPILSLDTVENLFICDTLGEAVKLDYIDGMNILSVASALNGLSARIIVTAEAVEGALTSYDGETIQLEGEVFTMSASLKEKIGNGTIKLPQLNEETVIYFDARGLVAVCELSPNTGWSYGFLTEKGLTSGLDQKLMVKVLTTSEGFKIFDIARNVKIDGEPYKKNHTGAYDALTSDKLNVPIKYRVTSFGEIKDIDTPTEESGEPATSLKPVKAWTEVNYTPAILRFEPADYMKAGAVAFTVPLTPTYDERDYAVGTVESMFKKEVKYNAAIYGEDPEELVNTVAVKYTDTAAEVAASDIIAVVDKVTRATDSEGNEVWKIYAVKEGASNTYTVADSIYNHIYDADPLEKGDIIRMSCNDRLEVSALERTFDNDTREISSIIAVEKPSDPFSTHLYPADGSSRMFYLAYGKTLRFKNNILQVQVDDQDIRYYFKGRVIVVDKEGVRVGSSSDFVLDASGTVASDVLIEMRYSNVRTIVVYKD